MNRDMLWHTDFDQQNLLGLKLQLFYNSLYSCKTVITMPVWAIDDQNC